MSNARKLADLVSDGLDDYEEGNWTPTFENTSGGTTSGKYKKIGDLVFVSAAYVHVSGASVSGGIYISNLPFTTANFTFSGIAFGNYPGADQYQLRATTGAPPSTSLYAIRTQSTSRSVDESSPTSFTTNTTITLQLTYSVS